MEAFGVDGEDRQHDASDGVDVSQRVQADPAEVARGRVPEAQSRPGVSGLVKGNREEDDGELNREIDDLEGDGIQASDYNGEVFSRGFSVLGTRTVN